MRDIWNPWHGCVKCSEGCENCYMYYLDRMRDKNGAEIYQISNSRYPLSKDRKGRFKIQSGETISVCMTSDFFLEDADPWRDEAWDVKRMRRDVVFYFLTKRPQRVADCLQRMQRMREMQLAGERPLSEEENRSLKTLLRRISA